jgi:predicted enzyme related to lactoylglutathione lyase
MVGAHSEVKGQNEMPGRIIVNFETPDVKGEFTRLSTSGMSEVAEPYQPGEGAGDMWLATLADPDGNLIQLVSPMPAQ